MKKLLRKEFTLCMHPTVPIMLLLSSMVLIPNYPYLVMCFYTTLALFFTCLSARENGDITYSMMLPISKKDVVRARIGFAVLVQLFQVLVTVPFIFLSAVLNPNGNEVGMDANLALPGLMLLLYGIFNFSFFTRYYRNTDKVGFSFLISSIAVFLMITLEIVCSKALPWYHNTMDVPGTGNLPAQAAFFFAGLLLYILLTAYALKRSEKAFEKTEI